MSNGGSTGGGVIPGGPLGPLLLILGGLGAAGLITWQIFGGGGGDPKVTAPTVVPPTIVDVVAPTVPAAVTAAPGFYGPAAIDRDALREGYDEDAVLLTITAYGMPARVSATADNPDDSYSNGFVSSCPPDDIYPQPCVSYVLAKRGASVTVSVGDSRAGYWPVLDYVRGAGCDIVGNGRDQTCKISLSSDVDLVALYSGGENPGLSYYAFPTCPTQRGAATSAWQSRCP